jgi:glutamate synthase (NADPH/NADH) small chain
VTGLEVIDMELGESDESGRARPIPVSGTEHVLDVDMVIPALGTSANPVIAQTTDGLVVNARGYIDVDDETQMTSVPGVFAGGDIVTGSATVILAMGAGRRAAAGILAYLGLVPSMDAELAGV